jgi:hypothetical protein
MKFKKTFILLFAISIGLSALGGCSPHRDRIQEALDKLESTDAVCINGNILIKLDAGYMGSMGMDSHFDITETDEGSALSAQVNTDALTGAKQHIDIEQYIIGDKVYIYCPQISTEYMDFSSEYHLIADEGICTSMGVFDFDAGSARFECCDTTITYKGEETDVLMAAVFLNNEQMLNLIRNLLLQQRSYGALSDEDMDETLDVFQSMEFESADYALFIDGNDNVIRLYISIVLSQKISGQDVELNIQMQYDILETGDAVILNVPGIQPQDAVLYETV